MIVINTENKTISINGKYIKFTSLDSRETIAECSIKDLGQIKPHLFPETLCLDITGIDSYKNLEYIGHTIWGFDAKRNSDRDVITYCWNILSSNHMWDDTIGLSAFGKAFGSEANSFLKKYDAEINIDLDSSDKSALEIYSSIKRSENISIQEHIENFNLEILQAIDLTITAIKKSYAQKNSYSIEKVLEFPPEYSQAAIGILSYFSEILRQKHLDMSPNLRIEQEGRVIRLIVESEKGKREIIEQTLADYGAVITGKIPVTDFLNDEVSIIRLQQKLDIAELEIRHTRQLLKLSQNDSQTLKEQIVFFKRIVEEQLSGQNAAYQFQRNTVLRAVEDNKQLIQSMYERSKIDQDLRNVEKSLLVLKEAIEKKELTPSENEEIRIALREIAKKSPDLLEEFHLAMKNTIYGVSGNTVFTLIQATLNMI